MIDDQPKQYANVLDMLEDPDLTDCERVKKLMGYYEHLSNYCRVLIAAMVTIQGRAVAGMAKIDQNPLIHPKVPRRDLEQIRNEALSAVRSKP